MVRAHAINAADPGSIPAGGPLMYVTSPSLSRVSTLSTANKGVCARKKNNKKKWGISYNDKSVTRALAVGHNINKRCRTVCLHTEGGHTCLVQTLKSTSKSSHSLCNLDTHSCCRYVW